MSNIPSARAYIQTEACRFRSAVSESLVQDIGASVNYLIDERDSLQSQINTLSTEGDVKVTIGTGVAGQFTGPQNIITFTHTFLSTEYVSIEFHEGQNFGIPATQTGLGQENTDFRPLWPYFFSAAGNFQLFVYNDASVVYTSPVAALSGTPDNLYKIYFSSGQFFFAPGAGSHTIRLYLNTVGGRPVGFAGTVNFKVHKSL